MLSEGLQCNSLAKATGGAIKLEYGCAQHSDCADRKFEGQMSRVTVVKEASLPQVFWDWARKRKRTEYLGAAKRLKRLQG